MEKQHKQLIYHIEQYNFEELKKMTPSILDTTTYIINLLVARKIRNITMEEAKEVRSCVLWPEIVNLPDNQTGHTPLWIAANKGNLKVISLLLMVSLVTILLGLLRPTKRKWASL